MLSKSPSRMRRAEARRDRNRRRPPAVEALEARLAAGDLLAPLLGWPSLASHSSDWKSGVSASEHDAPLQLARLAESPAVPPLVERTLPERASLAEIESGSPVMGTGDLAWGAERSVVRSAVRLPVAPAADDPVGASPTPAPSTSQLAALPHTFSLSAGGGEAALLTQVVGVVLPGAPQPEGGALTFAERVACQQAVEEVYWRHRLWPAENQTPKPELAAVLPRAAVEAKVEDTLRKSAALDQLWGQPLTGSQLQAEIDRMARQTQRPELLHEVWGALENDPRQVAECVARPLLADRLVRNWYAGAAAEGARPGFETWWAAVGPSLDRAVPPALFDFRLPEIRGDGRGQADTWRPTKALPEGYLYFTAVWTGSEVIYWGGCDPGSSLCGLFTGGRYNPATDTWTTVSSIGSPSRRALHSAVWTGTEMVVWGGCDTGSSLCGLFTGGRYNPATDTWRDTSTAGAPTARRSHSAVWTGSEMVIWGGCQPTFNFRCTLLGSGGIYNPVSDTWRALNTAGAPAPRLDHSTVWTGREMIVWGGNGALVPLDTGGRFDPFANTWAPTSLVNAPDARAGHTAVWTGTEMIVWGGDHVGTALQTGGRYNPATNTWTATSVVGAPDPRSGHTAVWAPYNTQLVGPREGQMIVWGGVGFTLLNTGGRYDPVTDRWTPLSAAGAPSPRVGHTAVWTGKLMVVWGGERSLFPQRTGGRYDPAADRWTPTDSNDAPKARELHSAVWTGTEMIVWGGEEGASGFPATGSRYDPATDSWRLTSTAGTPTNRSYHTALWTGTEMLIWGGITGNFTFGDGARYNPATDTWRPISAAGAPAQRGYHTGVWTGAEMVIWGGNSEGTLVATGGRYDPFTDSWRPTSMAGAAQRRYLHSAVWTGAEMVVWAGIADGVHVNTGGRYEPSTDTWRPTSTAGAPVPRRFHTAIWTGSQMVVWGGRDGPFGGPNNYFQTGGRYDPAADSWAPTSLTNAPSARAAHTAVWTGSRMVVWGGCAGSSFCNASTFTGGLYEPAGDTWAPTNTHRAPSARYNHSAVWTGAEMIVWGSYADQASTYTITGGRYRVLAR